MNLGHMLLVACSVVVLLAMYMAMLVLVRSVRDVIHEALVMLREILVDTRQGRVTAVKTEAPDQASFDGGEPARQDAPPPRSQRDVEAVSSSSKLLITELNARLQVADKYLLEQGKRITYMPAWKTAAIEEIPAHDGA